MRPWSSPQTQRPDLVLVHGGLLKKGRQGEGRDLQQAHFTQRNASSLLNNMSRLSNRNKSRVIATETS